MVRRIRAYVDTSALIALVDRSDSYHALFRRLFSDPPELLTTTLVVAEGHGWFLKRFDRYRAMQFLAMIEDMRPLHVLGTSARDQRAATGLLTRFSDQDLTMADATGLHLMQEKAINQCWSSDFHLGLTGVPLVIHQH
jgi:predicted nucleic acid-binding protein